MVPESDSYEQRYAELEKLWASPSFGDVQRKLQAMLVRAPEQRDEQGNPIAPGEISLDLGGKKPGRGAYVCRSADCLRAARKSHRLERAFGCAIPDEVYDRMEAELNA